MSTKECSKSVLSTDYYLCDVCGNTTFQDFELSYGMSDSININPDTKHPWPDGNVGDMAVICKECAKTHRIEIVTIEPER
ncbi:MAG: hypothetical protein IPK63_16095 [Candidatus Competibacteraceae bacterium]|nr:hypothetical protein [Candidatus Competibacteraceae bacterium]